ALKKLKISEQDINNRGVVRAKALFQVGNTYIKLGDLSTATTYLQRALNAYKETVGEEDPAYATTLHSLGVAHYHQEQFDRAEQILLQTLAIRKKKLEDKHPDYIEVLINLGQVFYHKGNYKNAKEYYLSVVDLCEEELGYKNIHYIKSITCLGDLYKAIGDYKQAEEKYLEALPISEEVLGEKHAYHLKILSGLGMLYVTRGDYKKAEDLYLKILKTNREVYGEKHGYYAGTLNRLGVLYVLTKNYKEAEKAYSEVLSIYKEFYSEKHSSYLGTLSNLGLLYATMKKYEKAEELFFEVIEVSKTIFGEQHIFYGKALENLGNLYMNTKDYKKAEVLYLDALDIYTNVLNEQHPNYITILNNLASLYYLNKQYPLAWQNIEKAILANSNISITKDIDPQTLEKLAQTEYVHFELMNYSLFAVYNLLDKEPQKQLLVVDLALSLLEHSKNKLLDDKDKLIILQQSSIWVQGSMSILNKEQEVAKAFDLIEQNKSVLLLDATSIKHAYADGFLPDSLVEQEKGFARKYADTRAKLIETRTENEQDSIRSILNSLNLKIDAFQKGIEQDYPKYASMKYDHAIVKANELQKTLDNKTALLEYFVADSMVYTICVTKNSMQLYELEMDKVKIKGRIRRLHNALSNYQYIKNNKVKAYQAYTKQAHWFYQNLIEPMFSQIQDKETLLVITDDELGHLPFETFLVEEANHQVVNYNNLHYLLLDYNIVYNYSATLWYKNQQPQDRENNGLILGVAADYQNKSVTDPSKLKRSADYQMRALLSPLPEARKEVEKLQAQFQGDFIFDVSASEANFKKQAANYRVLHLAMHGLLNKQEPLLSSLVFTENGDTLENNFLKAYEIAKLNLNADMVVLSACETGYGKFEQGNGIASLARSFMYARVPSLVVSLWQVNDRSTSMIMPRFYEHLSAGKTKSAALRQAKLHYIKSTDDIAAHPAFWSPFILIGDDSPIEIRSKSRGLLFWIGLSAAGLLLISLLFVKKKRAA
ncbi:MAG: CHAT domain-containing protein, partial [Saprospiraceae bacterium]|nr:CHAT domain-containing protein [Saprospiraceae bacterium]